MKARVEVQLYYFFNLGSRRGWVVNATPRPLHPWKRNTVPQGRPGQVRKISPPQGFDPSTVQSVACRFTD
jgi:hypothetical protein